jgi:hypothetical protein
MVTGSGAIVGASAGASVGAAAGASVTATAAVGDSAGLPQADSIVAETINKLTNIHTKRFFFISLYLLI